MTRPHPTTRSLAPKPGREDDAAYEQRGAHELREAGRNEAAGRDDRGGLRGRPPQPSGERTKAHAEAWGEAGVSNEKVYAPADRDRYATSPSKAPSTKPARKRPHH